MLADGIGCCIRMVVRRAAPSSLRMIIRSIVVAVRGLDNVEISRAGLASDGVSVGRYPFQNLQFPTLGACSEHISRRIHCGTTIWRKTIFRSGDMARS